MLMQPDTISRTAPVPTEASQRSSICAVVWIWTATWLFIILALLWNVLFPDEYPIEAAADFDGNGTIDVDDVLTLLWHVLFPEEYPL